MSWDAVAEVFRREFGSAIEKLVTLRYADHADDDRDYEVWPSVPNLASDCHVSERTVQRITRDLERMGVLDLICEAKHHAQRRYHFNLDALEDLPLTAAELRRRARRKVLATKRAARKDPGGAGNRGDTVSPLRPESGVTPVSPQPENRGDTDDGRGDTDGRRGDTGVTQSLSSNPQEDPESARAREAGGAHGPGGADAPPSSVAGGAEAPTKACAVWRDNQAALEALGVWPLLRRAIPDTDDGETLTLAVEAPAVGFALLAWAAPAAEAVLGRCLACRVHKWVQPALIERGIQKAGVPDASAHRREGETVTLQDPAWRLWRAKASQLGAPEIQAITALCLPDDLDQTGLVLMIGSAAIAGMLRDEGGQAVARALGVPIRTRFLWCMDIVLDARRAHASMAA